MKKHSNILLLEVDGQNNDVVLQTDDKADFRPPHHVGEIATIELPTRNRWKLPMVSEHGSAKPFNR